MILAFYTSRNAMLIVILTPIYYFLVFKVKRTLNALPLLLSPVLIAYFDEIFLGVSTENLNKVSSGRIEIWRLALENIIENGIFTGSGIFNLNDIVLQKNIGTGNYYFDRIDFLYFHNSFIELLAGGGLVLLLLFIWIVVDSWRYFSRIEKAIMCSVLIGGTLESYLTQPFMLISSLFYFILLMSNSQMKITKVKT
jgi:O-antigen ligase